MDENNRGPLRCARRRKRFNLINWPLSPNKPPKGFCLLLLGAKQRKLKGMRREH
jgi:hypothetical protein